KRLIMEGEGVQLDFKKTITHVHKIAKTIVSFANNKGGKILIGVMDDGSIKGVKSEEEEKYQITKAAQFYCSPPIEPKFSEHYFDGATVVMVEIETSNTKPHFALGEDQKWWAYIRVKDKSVLASKIVLDVLKKESKGESALIEFSSKEKALLEYLEANEKITLKEYCNLINISRRRASRILVNLVLSGVIRVHSSEKTEFYTAA
ncbi:MAG: helix-turn-helix domain-containing protein, partial [bacterium]